MDIATILGILIGLLCIFIAIMADGGNFTLFLCIPAIVIVVGGTFAATCVHFSLGQVLKLMPFVKKTLIHKSPSQQELIQKLADLAAVNRKDGALAVEQHLGAVKDPFMVKAIRMVIDGLKPDVIREQLSLEIENLQERHYDGKKMLEFMGAGCPAFGMVGTLIGLVQMFSNMESPEAIGKGMATALVCTFYGAFVANMFFIPLAGKLGIRSKKEIFLKNMLMEGVLCMAHGASPTEVREIMQTFVSVNGRQSGRASQNAKKAA